VVGGYWLVVTKGTVTRKCINCNHSIQFISTSFLITRYFGTCILFCPNIPECDRSIGLGITNTVRHHTRRLCDLQQEEYSIETELQQLLNDSRFTAEGLSLIESRKHLDCEGHFRTTQKLNALISSAKVLE